MSNIIRISVLLNKETQERFDENDIVKIKTSGTYGSEYIGRIDWVDTSELTLDTSGKYTRQVKKIKLNDIQTIENVGGMAHLISREEAEL